MASKIAQDSQTWFKIAPNIPPRGPKTAPRRLQVAKEPPKKASRGRFRWASEASRWFQDAPRGAQEGPQKAPRAPKSAPRRLQVAKEPPKEAPEMPKSFKHILKNNAFCLPAFSLLMGF